MDSHDLSFCASRWLCRFSVVLIIQSLARRGLHPGSHPISIGHKKTGKSRFLYIWRRERDSNPRYAINVYTLSRRAPSATQPSLQIVSSKHININTPLRTSPSLDVLSSRCASKSVTLSHPFFVFDNRMLTHSAISPNCFYRIATNKCAYSR